MKILVLLASLLLGLAACGGESERPPPSSARPPTSDGGAPAVDATNDVGRPEVETPPDAAGADVGPPPDVGGADAGTLPDAGVAVSFRRDIVPIFARSCGNGDSGCHSRFAYTAERNQGCRGWLSLADQPLGSRHPENGDETGCPDRPLHERLLRFTAWQCDPERRYVTPGAPAESQIFAVVSGNPGGGGVCNRAPGVPLGPMPPPGTAYTISADSVRLLEAWIRAGAPDN